MVTEQLGLFKPAIAASQDPVQPLASVTVTTNTPGPRSSIIFPFTVPVPASKLKAAVPPAAVISMAPSLTPQSDTVEVTVLQLRTAGSVIVAVQVLEHPLASLKVKV